MKKNVMLRVASCLLVAVLLSTCAISGTFAKYVTTGSSADSARVAEWGVTITGTAAEANGMFTKTYTNDENNVTVEAEVDVVAPGTSGTFAAFDISGKPEVDTVVTYAATVTLANWTYNNGSADSYYCPIVVKVNNVAVAAGATADEYATNIKNAIEACTKNYEANADLSAVESDVVITWEWAFEGNNLADTYLGDQAAKGTAATISVSVTATITQVN